MRGISLPAVLALALAFAAPARADDACTPKLIASLNMALTPDGGVTIPATMGTHHLKFLLRTGDSDIRMRKESALGAGLTPDPNTGAIFSTSVYYVFYRGPDPLQIGPWSGVGPVQVLDDAWGLGRLPVDIDGTFGMDRLLQAGIDIDLDFPHSRISFYSHCWFVRHREGDDGDFAQLDGRRVPVGFDTSHELSEISLETAGKLFGFSSRSYLLKPAPGGKGLMRYPFKSFSFGTFALADPPILVRADEAAGRGFDTAPLTIGTGIMRQLHLIFSFKRVRLVPDAAGAL